MALLARAWFKAQGLPHSADAVVAMAALALTVEREAREAEKRREWESENKIAPPEPNGSESEPNGSPDRPAATGSEAREAEKPRQVPPAPGHARRAAHPKPKGAEP